MNLIAYLLCLLSDCLTRLLCYTPDLTVPDLRYWEPQSMILAYESRRPVLHRGRHCYGMAA